MHQKGSLRWCLSVRMLLGTIVDSALGLKSVVSVLPVLHGRPG